MLSSNKKQAHAEKKKALAAKKAMRGKERAQTQVQPKPIQEGTHEPKPVSQPSELEKIVEESRATLAEEQAVPARRGRGRPRKDAQPLEAESKSDGSSQQNTAPFEQPGKGRLAPVFAAVVGLPFTARARSTGFTGYRLKPDEALELGSEWDRVAEHYFPQLSGTQSVLVSALLATGAVFLGKEMELSAFQEEREAERRELRKRENDSKRTEAQVTESELTPSETFQPPPGPPVEASQFFGQIQ